MDSLKRCGVNLHVKKIKDINTPEKFYEIQGVLDQAARKVNTPRIWFDDNWVARE